MGTSCNSDKAGGTAMDGYLKDFKREGFKAWNNVFNKSSTIKLLLLLCCCFKWFVLLLTFRFPLLL